MNLLPRWMWMTNEAMRQQEAVEREPDPGDMGTAFGLDACLLETASTPPTAPVALDDEPVSEPPLAWLSRRRRR